MNTVISDIMETKLPQVPLAKEKEQQFTDLVNLHLDEIYSYARYMVLDNDEAEDIAQKTFLSLYNNLHKVDLESPIKPWLFTVAKNHCLDFFKKKKQLPFSQVEEQVADIPESDETLEQQADDELFIAKVKQRVQQLPPPMREVILLKYIEDFTFEQIAEVLGQPVNTVKSNFYRGKTKLYEILKTDQD